MRGDKLAGQMYSSAWRNHQTCMGTEDRYCKAHTGEHMNIMNLSEVNAVRTHGKENHLANKKKKKKRLTLVAMKQ